MGTTAAKAVDVIIRADILELSNLYDEHGRAFTFYFGRAATPDESHRQELMAIKRLIKDAKVEPGAAESAGSNAEDLDELLANAERIAASSAPLTAIFACRERGVWREIAIPVSRSLTLLQMGKRFRVAPLVAALEDCEPYLVVLLESGKARAFLVRGLKIRELENQLPCADLALRAEDSRVGWSRHIDGDVAEHEKTYFSTVAAQLSEVMSNQQTSRLIIGCREDLWGEAGQKFTGLPFKIMGRFHLTRLDLTSAQLLETVKPIAERYQRESCVRMLAEINESSARAVFGFNDVLCSIGEGRVRRIVLGNLARQAATECLDCNRTWLDAGQKCVFCNSSRVCSMAAEEALVRGALKTDAEIIFAADHEILVPAGVAALLRY
jgi:peptide chain release factor subunit 1